ncbi:serine hydrolase domain-containing protein [Actinomycetospora chiangmaiensis]|uniref:serine hydrolase domain-containing protein n=1 Tax=Actinomycetospora chiangmaiensis TaxID=402650 RepID=UPI00036851A8|nr:serine hydrolase domain-containing protein [Actinomycetospora chiangmaiensis]
MFRALPGAALTVACLTALALGLTSCTSSPSPTTGTTTSATTPAAPALPTDVVAQIDRDAQASLTGGITGTVVSIVDPARGSFLKAYGTADTAGTPMTSDMHYRIASVSKTFTADAVLQLVGQGRLSLDAPLAQFVPDIPNGNAITVRDLLGMRGGVYDFTADADFDRRYEADPTLPGWTPQDVLAIVRANPGKAKPPNTTTVYSNSEYVLLGQILEKVTGRTAAETLDGVAGSLGLAQTSWPTGDALPTPFTRGYLSTVDGTTPPPYRDGTLSNPLVPDTAGALVSTVPDMTRYAAQLATGAGLPPAIAAQRQAWTPLTTTGVRVQYGLGITQLGDWVGHDGSIIGYSDMVFYLPSAQATVVVMVNAADGNAVPSQALWGQIVKLLYPTSLPSW